jgi:hypothetical protein
MRFFALGMLLMGLVVPAGSPSANAAVGLCPATTSLYGTVQSVRGNDVLVKTGQHGYEHFLVQGADLDTNGLRLRPGIFIGAFGCSADNFRTFRAVRATLAYSAATYPSRTRHQQVLTGTVVQLQGSRLLVQTGEPYGLVHVYKLDTDDVRAGQRISLTGAFNPDGSFSRSGSLQRLAGGGPERQMAQPHQPPHPPSSGTTMITGTCGGYRWPVKIAADGDASNVNTTSQDTTIGQLKALRSPSALPQGGRASGETTVYRLTNVTLASLYVEHDRDYHLIVSDGAGNSMTLESPDPACAAGSRFASQIASVRNYLSAHYSVGATTLHPNVPVTATGVAFFDPAGSGGLELHPLLSICIGQNCALTSMLRTTTGSRIGWAGPSTFRR